MTNTKKLKQNIVENETPLNEQKNKMIEQSNCVSNKEALKDKIHELHRKYSYWIWKLE